MSPLKSILSIASISSGSRKCTPEELATASEQEQLDTITPPSLPGNLGEPAAGAEDKNKEV